MKYNKITYYFDSKNKRYRFFFEGERIDEMGTWNSSGNYGDLYLITNHYVFIKIMGGIPVFVCDTVEKLFDFIKEATGIYPIETK